jgi:integrase/recombinase XerD
MQISEKDFYSFITIKRGLAAHSVNNCLVRFRIIKRWFGDRDLTKQAVEEFFAYLIGKNLKNNSLNTYYFAFYQIREYCKDRGLPTDFLDGFKSFKKTKPDIQVLTQEEIEKILSTHLTYGRFCGRDTSFLDFRYLTLTEFLACTGARFSEAANLKVKHLDISAGRAVFTDTKSNENRSSYFSEPLKSHLKTLVENKGYEDLVFRNSQENRIHEQDYIQDLKLRAKTAGVTKRIHPHLFRHSYATTLLETGVDITQVASLLGHRDIQTTYDNYMHLADKTLQNAALMHPIVRKNVDPLYIIKSLRETIEKFHLETDKRFEFTLTDSGNGLDFSVKLK